jgi:hypothetical protein
MQMGLVPVVTNVGGIKNYCKDNINCIIIKEDEDALKKITEVIRKKELYLYLSQNAKITFDNQKLYSEDFQYNMEKLLNNKFKE